MLKKLKIPIIIAVTALLTQFAGYAVQAAMPPAFLPAGTTRYAVLYNFTPQTLYGSSVYQDIPGTTKYITIPGGQTADLLISVCAQVAVSTGDGVQVRALVRGQPATPGLVSFDPGTTYQQECATFSMTGVTAGQPPIKLQVHVGGAYPDNVLVDEVHMIVTANLH